MEEQIKNLIKEMEESKLSNLEIEFPDGLKISMKKDYEVKSPNQVVITNQVVEEPQKINQVQKTENKQEEKKGNIVNSPMVGTCYLKPAPNADEYVKIGCRVKKGDVLCIVEAMKLMNEIESEVDGEIAEILINNGDAVEYGKPLFKIV